MKITTLVENAVAEGAAGVGGEHGVSLFLEWGQSTVLFDMGKTSLFLKNARAMGKSIEAVQYAVLSHGHYDHGGGLPAFFDVNAGAPVYCKPEVFGNFSATAGILIKKYIGLKRNLKDRYSDRFQFVQNAAEISPGAFILPEIIDRNPKPAGNARLLRKTGGGFEADPFEHELIFTVRENGGLAVFTGCAHNGILNMVESVERQFPGEPIKAVIGGFHLTNGSRSKTSGPEDGVAEIARQLKEREHIGKIYTGHCTGSAAYKVLKEQLGDKLLPFHAGAVISL